ncbi:nuclear transport factor 2 family protein [Litoribacillus peritrichatus]|uniref:SnoaL-like domain-containing protein n=1 Tax=Litoribacillus peritrichatus TaxID=718191 RepID=A0ABP7MKB7_9GAMM
MLKSNLDVVLQYFEMVDTGNEGYLELFTDDADFFFPKFGNQKGKAALIEFGARISQKLGSIWHDKANFQYIVAPNKVVVEGQEGGTLTNGTVWPDGAVSQGRFCSVFEFRNHKICRMYIYVDPDFGSEDQRNVAIFHRTEQPEPA